jgi:hypothetical protein
MKSIIKSTREYRYNFSAGLKGLTESHGSMAMYSLQAAYAQNETERCFEAVALAYSIASVAMFEPFTTLQVPRHEIRDPVPTNAAYTFLAIYLSTSGRVKIINPEWRQAQSCLWKALSHDQKSYKVSGAFDCKAQNILLDPFLRPLNMGAVFIHEIDHMFRDAAFDLTKFDGQLNDFLLMDETLALARSAYLQLHLRSTRGLFRAFVVDPKDDLSLYKRGGPFESIYELMKKEGGVTMARFFKDSLLPAGKDLKDPYRSLTESVYRTVHSTYFPGTKLSDTFISDLPAYSNEVMTPLNLWGNRLSGFIPSKVDIDLPRLDEPEWFGGFVRNGEPDSQSILRAIKWISANTRNPSKSCEKFTQEVKTSSYLAFWRIRRETLW